MQKVVNRDSKEYITCTIRFFLCLHKNGIIYNTSSLLKLLRPKVTCGSVAVHPHGFWTKEDSDKYNKTNIFGHCLR